VDKVKEFWENLKLKAGLSPKYWSEKIKVYRFRTVEIKRDENYWL
jgi:AMMECR1 domain-containing protein